MSDAEFFEARESLRHIRAVAHGRRVGSWSTLGATMIRVSSLATPGKRLPGLIGSQASLNLFVALTAGSGQGKGTSEAASFHTYRWPDFPAPPWLPIGTGEGVAKTYADDGPHAITAAVFTAGEVDGLSALAGRQGSTTTAALRSAFSGEALGFANAQKDTRLIIPAHSYRLCFLVGVQPERSKGLLAAQDGGLPQRFFWVPTHDVDAPDVGAANDPPPPRPLKAAMAQPGPAVLEVPESAKRAVEEQAVQRLHGTLQIDPLDAHGLLVQLKVAAALLMIDDRDGDDALIVTEEDWELAGYAMEVSRRTRDRCLDALQDQSRRRNWARAVETVDLEEMVSDRRLTRTKDGILRRLNRLPEQDPVLSRSDLRSGLKGELRDYFEAAIQELQFEGQVADTKLERGIGYMKVQGPALVQGKSSQVEVHGPTLDPGPRRDQFTHAMHLVKQLNSEVTATTGERA